MPLVRALFVLVVSGLQQIRERGKWRGLVANSTLPVSHGVSVRVIGNWLGLQSASWMTIM